MGPGCRTISFTETCPNVRGVVELIIPDHVVIRPEIHLIERGPNGVAGRITEAVFPLLECGAFACDDILLAKGSVFLHVAAEWALSRRPTGTARKRFGVELENEPPIHRVPFLQERGRDSALGPH